MVTSGKLRLLGDTYIFDDNDLPLFVFPGYLVIDLFLREEKRNLKKDSQQEMELGCEG